MGDDEMDELELAKELMAVDTTSPVTDETIFRILTDRLHAEGLDPELVEYDGVKNLVCTVGEGRPAICLNGHVDVVAPDGDWTETDPFDPTVKDGRLYGRGAADMKAAVAAQAAALKDLADDPAFEGSVTLMVVGDEEQGGFNGTKPLVDEQSSFDRVIVGEPTDLDIQVGTRGVLWLDIDVHGEEAHASKPHFGDNPMTELPAVLDTLQSLSFDHEDESQLPEPTAEVTVVETDDTQNSIPGSVHVGMDIRYTTSQDVEDILDAVQTKLDGLGVEYDLGYTDHGGAFLLEDETFRDAADAAVEAVNGTHPSFITSGGASDGRFFSEDGVPFIELGVEQETVHQADENCRVDDIRALREVYSRLVKDLAS